MTWPKAAGQTLLVRDWAAHNVGTESWHIRDSLRVLAPWLSFQQRPAPAGGASHGMHLVDCSCAQALKTHACWQMCSSSTPAALLRP